MSNANIIFGSQDGTGANIDIEVGFLPTYVKVVNIESAGKEQLDWYEGMAAASAIKTVANAGAAVDPRTSITTLGITPLSSTFLGFRIGADADVNVAGETLIWEVHRNGMGSGG